MVRSEAITRNARASLAGWYRSCSNSIVVYFYGIYIVEWMIDNDNIQTTTHLHAFFIFLFFLAFDFCRFCVVIRFFHPRHNGQWRPTLKDFLSQILSITFIFPILILVKEPVFSLLECSVLNKGTTGTIFITSLVWRGPWLVIEPGTSSTQSQHYTTRLSRRRFIFIHNMTMIFFVSKQP